jgi:hypothetical protein
VNVLKESLHGNFLPHLNEHILAEYNKDGAVRIGVGQKMCNFVAVVLVAVVVLWLW